MDSPTERRTKKIIVSLWSRFGFIGWRLATARKIGRHYVVDEGATDWSTGRRLISPIEAHAKGDNTTPCYLDNHHIQYNKENFGQSNTRQ